MPITSKTINHCINKFKAQVNLSIKLLDASEDLFEDDVIYGETDSLSNDDKDIINNMDSYLDKKWDKIKIIIKNGSTEELPDYIQNLLIDNELPDSMPEDIKNMLTQELRQAYGLDQEENINDCSISEIKLESHNEKLKSIIDIHTIEELNLKNQMLKIVISDLVQIIAKHDYLGYSQAENDLNPVIQQLQNQLKLITQRQNQSKTSLDEFEQNRENKPVRRVSRTIEGQLHPQG